MKVDPWGVVDGFVNAHEQWQDTLPETRRAIHRAMGVEESQLPSAAASACVIRQGAKDWNTPGTLQLEDGGHVKVTDRLPPDLPLGYHRFESAAAGVCQWVIVCPAGCVVPERGWGWAAQLYATRSQRSWGIGDLADLQQLAIWAKQGGASVLLINPVGAAAPVIPQESSPYYPASRIFRNPIYLAIEKVPGAARHAAQLEQIAADARRLNSERLINRDQVFRLKQSALQQLWATFPGDPGFDHFCRQQGQPLELFAAFCVLAETHGRDWHAWPAKYRQPGSAALTEFSKQERRRIDYHRWLQWLIDRQLKQAAQQLHVVQDLPIGVDPGGFDAWIWQDILARDVSVGAPPDIYNAQGQNWGLPPFVPHRLRGSGYEPFIQTIRFALRHAGGLRIDHVMGLFRLFWIPTGMPASHGAFVRYPADDLLGIIALESHRAGAFVVGEDLGTVEPEMRDALLRNKLLSYRLLWFEDDPPAKYTELALAAISTHDLPTIAGVCTDSDFKAQEQLGMKPSPEAHQKLVDRLARVSGGCSDDIDEVIVRAHAGIAAARSILVTATLDDALAVEERPNMPGTTGAWPNWSLALPNTLEEIEQLPLPRKIAQVMNQRVRK